MNSLSRRRTSDADLKIDLRWFAGRPRPCGSPRAGEEFRWPEDGRQASFGLLQGLPAGPRWIMDAIALRRDGRQAEGHRARTTNAVSPTALFDVLTDAQRIEQLQVRETFEANDTHDRLSLRQKPRP